MIDALQMSAAKLVIAGIPFSLNGWNFNKKGDLLPQKLI